MLRATDLFDHVLCIVLNLLNPLLLGWIDVFHLDPIQLRCPSLRSSKHSGLSSFVVEHQESFKRVWNQECRFMSHGCKRLSFSNGPAYFAKQRTFVPYVTPKDDEVMFLAWMSGFGAQNAPTENEPWQWIKAICCSVPSDPVDRPSWTATVLRRCANGRREVHVFSRLNGGSAFDGISLLLCWARRGAGSLFFEKRTNMLGLVERPGRSVHVKRLTFGPNSLKKSGAF